jgi:hypothetical protein
MNSGTEALCRGNQVIRESISGMKKEAGASVIFH